MSNDTKRLLTSRIRQANPNDAPRSRGPIRTPPRIGGLVSRAAQPVLKKMGFEEPYIVDHWSDIVGAELAQYVTPLKLSRAQKSQGKTLTVAAPGPLTLELQHKSPQILDRINAYYGHKAIEKLRIVHNLSGFSF